MPLFGKAKPKKTLEPELAQVQDSYNQAESTISQPQEVPDMPVAKPTNPFTYVKGEGKENKAEYRLGKASVPAALISRIADKLKGQSEQRQGHIIFGALQKKYFLFLDAIETAKLEYPEAFAMMMEVKPKKAAGTGTRTRTSSTTKTAEAIAKVICKRFKGEDAIKLFRDFMDMAVSSEFEKETIDTIEAFQKNYGTSPTGYTKTTNRSGNPAAIKALAKARNAKKK